ncbi:MAG: hypothetical protein LBK82_04040 [Planctomycetaceae bacterium]|nr:hypothetical protein [Planctomycetaceae bacterium]
MCYFPFWSQIANRKQGTSRLSPTQPFSERLPTSVTTSYLLFPIYYDIYYDGSTFYI